MKRVDVAGGPGRCYRIVKVLLIPSVNCLIVALNLPGERSYLLFQGRKLILLGRASTPVGATLGRGSILLHTTCFLSGPFDVFVYKTTRIITHFAVMYPTDKTSALNTPVNLYSL